MRMRIASGYWRTKSPINISFVIILASFELCFQFILSYEKKFGKLKQIFLHVVDNVVAFEHPCVAKVETGHLLAAATFD